MDWDTFIVFVVMNILPTQAYNGGLNINKILDLIAERRHIFSNRDIILRDPQYPEDIPEAEPIIPGHTLLKPATGMLKSAVKFPQRDLSNSAVYGNYDNLGITYGKTNERIRYSDFRKANNLLSLIMDLTENINNEQGNKEDAAMIVIEANPLKTGNLVYQTRATSNKTTQISEEENNANEILDIMNEDLSEGSDEVFDFRRRARAKKSKYRDRINAYSKSESISSSSGSSDYEKNPGNPYTIHKNKYMQNWMWNHKMDGDHMNINPYAPNTYNTGPSGAELFFARKWWYFNQDDYKPLR